MQKKGLKWDPSPIQRNRVMGCWTLPALEKKSSINKILNQYDCFRACSIANDDSIVHPPRLGLTVNYTANWSTAVSQTKDKVSMGNGHCIFMPVHYDLRLLPSLTWQWPHFCVQVKFTARSVLCSPEVRAWHCQKQKWWNFFDVLFHICFNPLLLILHQFRVAFAGISCLGHRFGDHKKWNLTPIT